MSSNLRVLGLMSGTSHDGVDAAIVDFAESDGNVVGRLLWSESVPYPEDLRRRLVGVLPPARVSLKELVALDTLVGQHFADVTRQAMRSGTDFDAVASHGQTVCHLVDQGAAQGSLQIGSAAWIAEAAGKPVISNFRVRDIAAGGQGAPLVSLLDGFLLSGRPGKSAALNLGGIANITVVGPNGLEAYDIGPANALIDAVIQAESLDPVGYDSDGQIALRGDVKAELLQSMLEDPYFQTPPPKSTGKEHFNLEFVRRHIEKVLRSMPLVAPTGPQYMNWADLISTLTELTVVTVAEAVKRAQAQYLAVSGGGAHNPVIMAGLSRELPGVEIVEADALGVPVDDKEAILCALIGWCTLHGIPGGIPAATGARESRILGDITPGSGPLQLPEPVPALVSLRFEGSRT